MLVKLSPAAFGLALLIAGLSACVPARQVEEIKAQQEECEQERSALASAKKDLEATNNELTVEMEGLKRSMAFLDEDTTRMGNSLRKMTVQYDKINTLNDELLGKMRELQAGSEAENRKLLEEYNRTQLDLQQREDELKKLERELDKKKSSLDKLSGELKSREQRVTELEGIIAQQDAAVNALRDKVAAALFSFRDKGLSVEERNGKIYVSLDAKLLFPKGSTNIDSEGKKAILGLCEVIVDQKDISIAVEGHTDTDPIKGGSMKDNWDLSVLRSTSVVRLMVEKGKIDPKILTASGRGEYIPVDEGEDEAAKAKNRRIEIILIPDLDELYKILED